MPGHSHYYLTMEACDGKFYEAIFKGRSREIDMFRKAVYYPNIPDYIQDLAKPDEDDDCDDLVYPPWFKEMERTLTI